MKLSSVLSAVVLAFIVGQAFFTISCGPSGPFTLTEIGDGKVTAKYKLDEEQFFCEFTSDEEWVFRGTYSAVTVNGASVQWAHHKVKELPSDERVHPATTELKKQVRLSLEYRKTSESDWTNVPFTAASLTEGTEEISGLENEVEYEFRFTHNALVTQTNTLAYEIRSAEQKAFKSKARNAKAKCMDTSSFEVSLYVPYAFYKNWVTTNKEQFFADSAANSYTVTVQPDFRDDTGRKEHTIKATPRPKPKAFAITKLTATDTTATVEWSQSDGATKYYVCYYDTNTTRAAYPNCHKEGISTTDLSLTVSALEPRKEYTFVILATNGQYDTGSTGTLTDSKAVTTTSSAPRDFGVVTAIGSDGQVSLDWDDVLPDLGGTYDVLWGTTSGSYTEKQTGRRTSDELIIDLTNDTTYYFKVVATNSGGVKSSAEVSATPTAGAPGAFTISTPTPGNGQATLSWGTSSGATSYTLKYGTSTGSYPTTVSTNATSPTTVTGLTNGTTYYFMVTAVNSGGSTNATAEQSTTPVAPPGTFTISGVSPGNSQVAVSWGASTGATSYTVKYGTSTGSYPTTFSTNATSPTTVTGLTNGTTYYFMVTAVNAGGSTNATSQMSSTPAAAPPGAFSISSTSARSNRVSVYWGASTGATSYTVKYGTSTGSYPTTFSTSATSPTTVTGLTNGTTYYFMVTAVNGSGSTDATAEANATPTTRKMYVTALSVSADLSGGMGGGLAVTTADGFCSSDASKPSGGGTYKAVFAGSVRKACTTANCGGGPTENSDWTLAPDTAYVRADATPIGTTNANGIFTFPLTTAISTSATSVLTGLETDWTNAADNCSDWASASGGDSFTAGDATAVNSTSINNGTEACSTTRPLLCAEQW